MLADGRASTTACWTPAIHRQCLRLARKAVGSPAAAVALGIGRQSIVMSADSGGQHNLTFEGSVNPGGSMSHSLILCDSIAGRVLLGRMPVRARVARERKPGC
jgi:hypothetical protein